ncbi:MAG: LysM peptidoglycan-binding domain-containing protein [Anaerolineae bacterium]|nr:LysM peptidoglycan-binding domain-containing protein [Anaerolineae bacterium]NIN96407.1 LysM peptidoglycan-binding domain-containing protein [Anaerolineae bacterium]NIQ79443.1 LysM peptidoglycan-binding domain-containing protein [Anaerolineae bacterium]
MGRRKRLQGLAVLVALVVQLVLFAGPVDATPGAAEPIVHVVRWGETLHLIARRYGTTIDAIARANNLHNPNFVYAGQRLAIPTNGFSPSAGSNGVYVVQRGDTLRIIASRYGTSVSYLASLNGLRNPNFIWVGQRLKVPSSSGATPPAPAQGSTVIHVVQRGEILARIAQRYGTTVSAIAAANNLSNPSFIYVGQRLKIPSAGSSPASTAPAPSAPSSPASSGEKWIDVNLSTQTLQAYEGNRVVYTARVSTGISRYPTPTGTYRIQRKYWYDDMTGGSHARGDYYYLPDVPYCMYYYAGYSLHGTYWHNNFGTPMSHGCTNLSIPDAGWLFNWAPIGTKVVNHY